MPNHKATLPRQPIEAICDLTITAAQDDGTRSGFSMTPAYSGGPLQVRGYDLPVYVDLETLKLPTRPSPVLHTHDRLRPVGFATPVVEANQLNAPGHLLGSPDADEIRAYAAQGFPWSASIGVTPGRTELVRARETRQVNGRTAVGPCYIARHSRLNEISILAIGADDAATTTVAAEHPQDQDDNDMSQPTTAPDPTTNSLGNSPAPIVAELDSLVTAAAAERRRRNDIARLAKQYLDQNHDPDIVEAQATRAMTEGITPEHFELALLRLIRPTGRFGAGSEHRQRTQQQLEAALDRTLGTPTHALEASYDSQTLDALDRDPELRHGFTVTDLLCMAARTNGGERNPNRRDINTLLTAAFGRRPIEAAHGFTTIDVGGILSNVANKQLERGFNAVDQTWRTISAVKSVNDLKLHTAYSLTGDNTYEPLAPTGEIQHGTLGEISYVNQAKTYARMLAIPRTDLINDDISALDGARTKLGQGAARKFNDVFWTAFMDNATFFTVGRKNYKAGTDTVLGLPGLTLAEQYFLDQTDPDGKPLGTMPKYLLVPTPLYTLARQITNSTEIRPAAGSSKVTEYTANPHNGMFTPVTHPYLSKNTFTGYSTTKWYLLADPNDMPVIESCFYLGKQTPTVETSEADFNTLGIQMRGFWDFGVSKHEYRGGVAFKGAA